MTIMITNNIKQLKRKLSLISLGNTILPSVKRNKGYNIQYRTMFTISNSIFHTKTILVKPTIVNIITRSMFGHVAKVATAVAKNPIVVEAVGMQY
jgi:hypothetical protein